MSLLNLNNIKKTEWYRQETEANPYFAYAACCGCLNHFKSETEVIWYCTKDEARAYLSKAHLRKCAESCLEDERRKHGTLDKNFKDWIKKVKHKNIEIYGKIDAQPLTELPDKKLLSLNKELAEQCFFMWTQFFMDIFDNDAESLIEMELVNEKVILTDVERNIMMSQEALLAYQRSEKELLKIVEMIKLTSGAVNTFLYITTPSNLHRLKLYPIIDKAINEYQQNYFWIQNSWGTTKLFSVFEIVDNIKQVLSGPRDTKKELSGLINFEKNILLQKKEIADRHKLSPWLRQMFHFFGLLAYWRDERKVQIQQMNHHFEVLGKEIAGRSSLSWDEIKLLDSRAIDKIPVDRKLVEHYRHFFTDTYLLVLKSGKVVHLDKKECKEVFEVIETKINSPVSEIRGMIACPGKAKGEVAIITKPSEFGKMKQGMILVTPMTRPEHLPLMKKAAAIVTDEGGITSHAAVVSRELKVPCIIGTQCASKVLKDGDLVEVNANHGVVRKIS